MNDLEARIAKLEVTIFGRPNPNPYWHPGRTDYIPGLEHKVDGIMDHLNIYVTVNDVPARKKVTVVKRDGK